mgnify:CR=1 FL=1
MSEINREHDRPQDQHYGQYDLGLKAFIRSMKIAFLIMAVLIIGMLVYFFAFGGLILVEAHESVLLVKFGKVQDVYTKGVYWAFPRPINEFVRIPMVPQTFSVSFEAQKNPMQEPGQQQGGALAPGRDNYLLSGDANIVHTRWNVVFKISDARKYYESLIAATAPFNTTPGRKADATEEFYSGGPVVMMQNLLRSIVIKTTATQPVEQTLYNNQKYIDMVLSCFIKAVADMNAGLAVESVTIGAATPPLGTKAAFDEVSNARQEREKMISDALAYQVEQENGAKAEKVMVLAEATNYRKRVVSEIKSETFYFNKINEEYNLSPDTVLVSLYNYALSDVLSNTKDKFIIYKSARGNQEVRLKINPEPKDVRKTQNK